MSQKPSGFDRKDHDAYETPPWVTMTLLPHLVGVDSVWEPACGSGKMVKVLRQSGMSVFDTDIRRGHDFLSYHRIPAAGIGAIVTNPPYSIAAKFIDRALDLTKPSGCVAMLLKVDFDSGKTRQRFFADCPAFAKKIVLTKRIMWFDGTGAGTTNHAWFVWDWRHRGPPILAWEPRQ